MTGSPIRVSALSNLSLSGGRLLFGGTRGGTAVYAAALIRERRVILDRTLLTDAALCRNILVHELFHFVWPRLSNALRASFENLLRDEWHARAKGELGESAEIKKERLRGRFKAARPSGVPWRDYLCESFCDTAAWLLCPVTAVRFSMLSRRWAEKRQTWFRRHIGGMAVVA